jgi:hypothetical protein
MHPTELRSQTITSTFRKLTKRWDQHGLSSFHHAEHAANLSEQIEGLHSCNQYSWYADDTSRTKAPDHFLMQAKRELDRSNLMRTSFMEKIDANLVLQLRCAHKEDFNGFEVNSETIGQMIDRLSVQTLKLFFLERKANRCEAHENLMQVRLQIKYVSYCFDKFVTALVDGRACMLAYKQYKLYENSPEKLRK